MQRRRTRIQVMDPDHLTRVKWRLGMLFAFIAALWGIHGINWATGFALNPRFGLIPRDMRGLDGVLGMPWLHVSVDHLLANTVPLLLMGVLLATTATRALAAINAVIVLGGGVLVWIFASSAVHVGASGLAFGWFGFLLVRGLVDRSVMTLAISAAVGVLYGSLVWGVLPGQDGVSWESHLFGALAGIGAAVVLKNRVHMAQLRRF